MLDFQTYENAILNNHERREQAQSLFSALENEPLSDYLDGCGDLPDIGGNMYLYGRTPLK